MALNGRPQIATPETKTVVVPPRTLILSGVQGSGKGTQGNKLIKDFSYNQFEMGAVLREQAGRVVIMPELKNIELGKIIKSCPSLLAPAAEALGCNPKQLQQVLEENPNLVIPVLTNVEMTIGEIQGLGALVPQNVVMAIADEFMAKSGEAGNLMFDGMPRTVDQNAALEGRLAEADRLDDTHMLLINISDDVARANIAYRAVLDGRKDDADPATVERRIGTFHKLTKPIADRYDSRGKLIVVNGETGIDMTEPTRVATQLRTVQSKFSSDDWRTMVELEGDAPVKGVAKNPVGDVLIPGLSWGLIYNKYDAELVDEARSVLGQQLKFSASIKRSIDDVYQRVLASFPKN